MLNNYDLRIDHFWKAIMRYSDSDVWLVFSRLWICSTARCRTESCWRGGTWCVMSAARTATANSVGCTNSPQRRASATRRAASSWRGRWWGRAKASNTSRPTIPEFIYIYLWIPKLSLQQQQQNMDLHWWCSISPYSYTKISQAGCLWEQLTTRCWIFFNSDGDYSSKGK